MAPLYEIKFDKRESFYWSDVLTDSLVDRKIPGSRHFVLTGKWGSALFQNIRKKGFSIWYNHYHSFQRRKLHLRSESSTIILSLLIQNNLCQSYVPFSHRLVKESQFNIYYLPFVEKNLVLEADERYTILEIHCTSSFLKRLEAYFPNVLDDFFNSIEKEKALQIFPIYIFGTNSMIAITRQLLKELQSTNVNEFILELNVKLLISYAIACKSELSFKENVVSIKQLNEINKISNKVLKNLFDPPLIKELAQEARMNETTFKKLFKIVTLKPPYQYWSNYRMEAAFEKIISSTDSITDIALDFGFSTVTNFSKAFKKQYKLSPSAFRK